MSRRKSSRVRRLALSDDDGGDDYDYDQISRLPNDYDYDQISRLPNDVIHHIFSFIDTRSIVQGGCVSKSWRNTWKFHPHLNFDISPSPDQTSGSKFSNFVHSFLSLRDDVTELSTVNFRSNSISRSLLREIIIYAMSHRTLNLKIEFSGVKQTRRGGFDSSLFRSQHLKHLFLSIDLELKFSPSLTWDFPNLTNLTIERVTFTLQLPTEGASKSIDLFSGFPNLKTLSLDACLLSDIETFIIKSSELVSLSLKGLRYSCNFVVSAPKLSSFTYHGLAQFSLTASDLLSLKEVNFQAIYHRSLEPRFIEMMIRTFQQLYKAKSLTLNLDTLKFFSKFPELRERQTCPFTSLQSLTLVSRQLPRLSAFTGVMNYFSRSSPDFKVHIGLEPTPSRFRF